MGENTIVINGQRYDARTGKVLAGAPATIHNTRKNAAHTQPVGAIDGFSRKTSTPKAVAPAHGVHRKLEKSKILMRGAVNKPVSPKVHSKAQPVANHSKPVINNKQAHTDSSRLTRAAKVPKSTLISRFGMSTAEPATKQLVHKTEHLPVKHAPPISEHHSSPLPLNLPNPFARAIESAASHQQPSHKKQTRRHSLAKKLRVSPKTLSAGSMVLAGLLFGGFFVYQNIPNLAVKVAAARSGVPASLPGYKPAGFALDGPIKYSAGKISINYRSTTDDRNFAITQSTSEWNNEALLDNFVVAERRTYQTYQDKGKTIYIYEDDNATWVEDGVWYQVEGTSSLNSDQLLRIANSL